MARIRYLKMGFFENEDLATFPPHHRLCFQGLWLLADRAGRLEDRPKRIHAKLFPYEPGLDVSAMLHDLTVKGFIGRYQIGDLRIIQVLNFLEHQRPRHDEPASILPAQPIDALGRPLTEDQSLQHVNAAATDRTLPSDKSPLGIGIGTGIGIGMGGPPALGRGNHKAHAICGKVCLPGPLFGDFVQRMQGIAGEPERYVTEWFHGWNARYSDGDRATVIIGDDAFDFWRKRWAESHPSAEKPKAKASVPPVGKRAVVPAHEPL